MTDAVGQDHVESRDIEWLAWPKKLAGKFATDEIAAVARGAMHNQDGVVDNTPSIAMRLTKRAVMDAEFGKHCAGGEVEITQGVIAFCWRGIVISKWLLREGKGEQCGQKSREHLLVLCASLW